VPLRLGRGFNKPPFHHPDPRIKKQGCTNPALNDTLKGLPLVLERMINGIKMSTRRIKIIMFLGSKVRRMRRPPRPVKGTTLLFFLNYQTLWLFALSIVLSKIA
jgi:hypothetical protein